LTVLYTSGYPKRITAQQEPEDVSRNRPRARARLAGWWILSALPLVAAPPVPSPGDAAAFRQTVDPFLARHCVGCHNEKVRSGEVDLAALRDVRRAFHERQLWEQALRKIRTGEMPPPGSPRPPAASVAAVTRWIEELIELQDRAVKPDPGRVTARRLNRTEYNHTVRDLLGVDLDPAAEFPADDSGYGFDNIGDVLSLSPVLMEKYLAAAEKVVRAALGPPRKVQPTMERYQSPRTRRTRDAVGGRMLVYSPRGAAEVRHRFAFDGEYEMRIQVGDRRKDGSPPIRYVLTLDGKPVAEHDVEPGDYKNRIFDYRFTVTRGEHTLGGFFPPEALALAEQAREPLKPGQKPPEDSRMVYTDFVEVRGPFRVDAPASRRRLFVFGLAPAEQNRECAQRILGPLARRAFRRPLRPGELDRLLGIYSLAREEGEPFEQAIGYAVQAILVSPHFLFRIEQDPDPRRPDAIRLLNDHELATRLSYFLWSAPPDAALDRAADRGQLRGLAELERQALRMLRDPKAQALVENFAGQWLHLRNLESVKPDPDRFPDFDEGLRVAMQRETELFFAHVMREDRPILDFLDAPYTFVNERLAEHYGIAGVAGDEFRRVDLDGVQRSGVLTHASILTISSYPTRTSPRDSRQVDPRKHSGRPPAASATGRPRTQGRGGRPHREPPPANGETPHQPGVRLLPRAHGHNWLWPGKLRRDRPLANSRRQVSGGRRRRPGREVVWRACRTQRPAPPGRQRVRPLPNGKDAHLCARPGPDPERPPGGAGYRKGSRA
jgi:hypothetical protein